MTIAAGFDYRDGVLLCADTQHTTSSSLKLQGSKLAYFTSPSGTVTFAYAGNSAFAIAAVQRCRRMLRNAFSVDLKDEIETILAAEYHRNVLSHPSQANDGSLHYQFVIGIREQSTPALLATWGTSLREVDGYECIGIGETLAHHVIRPIFKRGMAEQEIFSLSAYALGAVKRRIEGCGGVSEFLALGNDGSVRRFRLNYRNDPRNCLEWIEEYSNSYEQESHELLFAMANPDVTDAEFQTLLNAFNKSLVDTREKWREQISKHPKISLLSWRANSEEGQLDPESTTTDRSHQSP